MLASVSVSYGTYITWQTVLVLLSIISTALTIWRTSKGSNKSEMTFFREEVMARFSEIKAELDTQTERLEAHIDRTNTSEATKPVRRRRKPVEGE
jgi:hypothetical protein